MRRDPGSSQSEQPAARPDADADANEVYSVRQCSRGALSPEAREAISGVSRTTGREGLKERPCARGQWGAASRLRGVTAHAKHMGIVSCATQLWIYHFGIVLFVTPTLRYGVRASCVGGARAARLRAWCFCGSPRSCDVVHAWGRRLCCGVFACMDGGVRIVLRPPVSAAAPGECRGPWCLCVQLVVVLPGALVALRSRGAHSLAWFRWTLAWVRVRRDPGHARAEAHSGCIAARTLPLTARGSWRWH